MEHVVNSSASMMGPAHLPNYATTLRRISLLPKDFRKWELLVGDGLKRATGRLPLAWQLALFILLWCTGGGVEKIEMNVLTGGDARPADVYVIR